MTLAAAARLGPYEIVALIGAGGMGEVYRARDTRLGREVAVKVLPADYAADTDRLRRFEQEARAAGRLNHPNILTVFDVGTHEGALYIVTELLEGESLGERVRPGSLGLRKAVEIAVQIAHGLAAAHEKGIIHRDLKPANVFVTKDGHVKILDFGVAKLTHPEVSADPYTGATTSGPTTWDGVVVGTAGYISPEQLRGVPTDHRSDIFALGCVLYEMLSGKPPFLKDTGVDMAAAILHEEPAPITVPGREIPLALRAVVDRCLEKQPEERFQSARDLAFNLETLSGSGATNGRIEAMPPSRRIGQIPALAVGAALGAMIVLLAGCLAWWQRWPPFRVPTQPAYESITFRQGSVMAARFTPDGREVLYSAAWEEEPLQTYAVSLDKLQEQPVGPSGAALFNLTARGDVLLLLEARHRPDVPATPTTASAHTGTLAIASWIGQLVPKERLKGVLAADISPDGTLAVVREEAGRSRLECPPGTVRAETAGTLGPVRFSPNGEFLAFNEHPVEGDLIGRVSLLDLRTGRTTVILGPSDWLEGLAWKGSELWCSALDTIMAVRPVGSTREVLKLPGYVILEDISPDGRVLLSRHDWRFGLLAFGEEGAPPQVISRDVWPWLEDLAADGRILFAEQLNPKTGGLYVASGDGSPAVRVGGEGTSFASLAPDRPWVAAWRSGSPPHLALLPTGAGEPRELTVPGLEACIGLGWTRDGRLLISGFEAGKGRRVYLQNPEKGSLAPITEEGISFDAFMPPKISPDGTSFLARSKDRTVIVPLREQRGEPRPVKGVEIGEKVAGWCADSLHLFVVRWGPFPIQVWTLDPDTGHREKTRTIDPKGYHGPPAENIFLTPDGKRGAMLTRLWHSELFVVSGLK